MRRIIRIKIKSSILFDLIWGMREKHKKTSSTIMFVRRFYKILNSLSIDKGLFQQNETLARQGFSMMENRGLEPLTSTLPALRSPS
jgi:hypothetical protein